MSIALEIAFNEHCKGLEKRVDRPRVTGNAEANGVENGDTEAPKWQTAYRNDSQLSLNVWHLCTLITQFRTWIY